MAILACVRSRRLTRRRHPDNRDHKILRVSFWLKLFFIVVGISLVIAFAVLLSRTSNDAAGVLEWTIAFIFSLYVFSFALDLYPAVRTRDPEKRFSKDVMLMGGGVEENSVPSQPPSVSQAWMADARHHNNSHGRPMTYYSRQTNF